MLSDEFCDIYGLQYIPFWQRSWFGYLLLIIMIVVVSALCVGKWFFYRKKSEKSPYEQALMVLTSQKIFSYMDQDHGQEFYTILMRLIKVCLSDYLGQATLSKTDSEVIVVFAQTPCLSHWKILFKDIASRVTTACFANQKVDQELMKNDLQGAITLVTEMKLVKEQSARISTVKK